LLTKIHHTDMAEYVIPTLYNHNVAQTYLTYV